MPRSSSLLGLAATVLATGCSDATTFRYADYDPHPETPAVMRDVAMIDDDVNFTAPYVPGHRTTMDGRLALRVQGGPPGTQRIAENLSFYLFSPEKLSEPIMPGAPGAAILAQDEPFDVPFPPALNPAVERLGHHAICDPTQEFPVAGEQPNPYACGPNDAHDCYAITIVSSTAEDVLGTTLWGTPATIEVENPKTASARIVDVTLGTPVEGVYIPLTAEWTEPAITQDGRLLTGRLGRSPRDWTNPETGETFQRSYDLAYAVLPDGADPCDVTGWTDFHPMSHAPYDPQMVGRYGLAAYPFRDSEGALIPDGEDLGGTYPWVDREGANLFMAAVPGRMVEQSETRYPRRCVQEGCDKLTENTDWDRGFLVAGLWTHGKLVHLDAMINNMDWAVGVTPGSHFMVDMYRGGGGEVRFGSGRFIDSIRDAGGPYPTGYTHNANILDSLQNLPNFAPAAKPVTPRDVVWIMSTGVATDEVAFDDYLDPNALIVSNMQASITQEYSDDGRSLAVPKYHNGQVRSLATELALPQLHKLEPDEDAPIHIQNGATSLRWNVPPFGLVDAGTGRLEPIALGGIKGKGFWLSGENEVRYEVPEQPRSIRDTDWYVGVFVDTRAAADETRTLLAFPDGSSLRLTGRTRVEYVAAGTVVHTVTLPDTGDGWVHLAWRMESGSRQVTLLHDGFPLDRFEHSAPLFELSLGTLRLGRAAASEAGVRGFRGWVDELKVFAYAPNLEVSCNHAHGTLVQLADADGYPAWAHAAVAEAAKADGGARFACFHDHGRDYGAHLANLPSGATGLRDAVLFPEGPLRTGVPRPDSSQNPFCLTCHTDAGKGGLTLEALTLDSDTLLEDDPRRQPLQPPRRVFGNVPGGWIPPGDGAGSPADGFVAPPEGVVVDPWLLPPAN